MSLGHQIKSALPRFLRTVFRVGQRFKVNITPNHFYSDIPDIRALERDQAWRRPLCFAHVGGSTIGPQVEFFEQTVASAAGQLGDLGVYERACQANGEPGYGPIEALFLHAFVKTHRPRRVVQVGCGVSTELILAAAGEAGYETEITCIEPFPTANLKSLAAARKIRLIPDFAQRADESVFTDLTAGDLLFIDSSHTIKVGSEVVMLVNNIFARLRPGVRIHFHDITFPYSYAPNTLEPPPFFWLETTLLHARLVGDPTLKIDCSLSMLHNAEPQVISKHIPVYRPRPMRDGLATGDGHYPSAIYLSKTDATHTPQPAHALENRPNP